MRYLLAGAAANEQFKQTSVQQNVRMTFTFINYNAQKQNKQLVTCVAADIPTTLKYTRNTERKRFFALYLLLIRFSLFLFSV